MGALEEIPQAELVRPVCRYLQEVREARHLLSSLHKTTAWRSEVPGHPVRSMLTFA